LALFSEEVRKMDRIEYNKRQQSKENENDPVTEKLCESYKQNIVERR